MLMLFFFVFRLPSLHAKKFLILNNFNVLINSLYSSCIMVGLEALQLLTYLSLSKNKLSSFMALELEGQNIAPYQW